ncbi:MAG: bifunctional precorrin-2 dehydrogenase/sirohydrochlorin ferrochelatase [Tannerella sp.]|nr:bifunctional precorrin-2 dehydrogenase/sirohydrochlorin ferrochelatase [Tannerella sp.]
MTPDIQLNFLPISVNITGKKIMIIGGGKTGLHKATLLSRFTDRAFVVSPEFHEGFNELPFQKIRKNYERSDLAGVFLLYVCTGDETLNSRIKRDAQEMGILTSVCDNPQCCDFISPAIYKEGNVTVAVSSNAENVRQSIDIRNRIRQLVAEGQIRIKRNGTL